MEQNPYTGIRSLIRNEMQGLLRPGTHTGVVASLTPLTISVEGVPLSGKDLLVNADLLPRARPVALSGVGGALSGSCGGRGDCAGGPADWSVSSGSLSGALAERAGTLAIGDRVILLGDDGAGFVVLCKVVEA